MLIMLRDSQDTLKQHDKNLTFLDCDACFTCIFFHTTDWN